MHIGKEEFCNIVIEIINGLAKINKGKLMKKKNFFTNTCDLMYFLPPVKRPEDSASIAGTNNANPIKVALTCAVVEKKT